ncbi:MAG TPA: hypothetical protein GX708_05290 [Gallicola sp.]|nr:hypothetical protein [Gallicola sp.]
MKVLVKFALNSSYYQNGIKQETFKNVQEVHYNYTDIFTGSNRLAIECADTSYIYNINDIAEIEISD